MAAPKAASPAPPKPLLGGGTLPEGETAQPKWAVWAVRLVWLVLAVLIVAAAAAMTISLSEKSVREGRRKAWDKFFLAAQEADKAETPAGKIAAYEKIAPEVRGTVVHPYLLAELGRLYFARALDPKRLPGESAADLDVAEKCFKTLCEAWGRHPVCGVWGAKNLAEIHIQKNELDAAVEVLEKAAAWCEKENTFFYPDFCRALARAYWLRSQVRLEKDPQTAAADLKNARKWLGRAVRGGETEEYAKETDLLKSLVEPPGEMLPPGEKFVPRAERNFPPAPPGAAGSPAPTPLPASKSVKPSAGPSAKKTGTTDNRKIAPAEKVTPVAPVAPVAPVVPAGKKYAPKKSGSPKPAAGK